MKVAILGGTGKEGQGIALRLARVGVEVIIGSRDEARAVESARHLAASLGSSVVSGGTNAEAAALASIVVSTLPHAGHLETLASMKNALSGKLLLVATVVWPPGVGERPSAAEEAQSLLPDARVVAAFQTVSAAELKALDRPVDDDVLVCGDSPESRKEAVELIARAGMRGVDAGPLVQARTLEALTGLLIQVNKNYRVKSAGIRITGLPDTVGT